MINFSVEGYINSCIADERKNNKKVSSDNFYATELGNCSRKAILRRAGFVPEPFNARTLRVFEIGNLLHEWITDMLGKLVVAVEIPAKQDGISGRADAIVEVKGKNILYEFKSVNSNKFTYLKSDSDPHYNMQAAFYQMVLQKKYKIVSTRLVYFSKDDLRIKEVEVSIEKWKPEVEKDIAKLQRAWGVWQKTKELPPALEKKAWQCKYCQLRKQCKEV